MDQWFEQYFLHGKNPKRLSSLGQNLMLRSLLL